MANIELRNYKPTTEKYGQDNIAFENEEYPSQNNGPTQPRETPRDEELGISAETRTEENAGHGRILGVQLQISKFYRHNKTRILYTFLAALLILYAIYFVFAMRHRFGDEGSIRLLWVTCVVLLFFCLTVIQRVCGGKIGSCMEPCLKAASENSVRISWAVVAVLFLFIVIFVIVDVVNRNVPYNLVSASGLLVYVLLLFIFSHNPAKVRWRPVVWGLGLQFIFALLILRTPWGREAFSWLGARVSEFLDHTDAGSQFVFGAAYMDHFFAFKVLPIIVFFSTVISVLYYLGVMQWLILKMAAVMQRAMGTSASESLSAAGNIFLGQTESPLLVRPLLKTMTKSELHAVMTGGFSTIAGSVLGAYIAMGIPADHLLSASVMSAPAALALAKLSYPETEKSEIDTSEHIELEKSPERNIIEAASSGASTSIKLVANIAANLISFIAILAFINATLTWLGVRVGLEPPDHPYLTFELICSYALWPFALVMGVDLVDCRKVAQLIGVKTFLNEFIAYERLSVYVSNSDIYRSYNGTVETLGDDLYLVNTNTTLVGGVLEPRSVVIATYALCGFANLSSIGIQLGGIGAMAPERKGDLAKLVFRAMIAGNVACFMTASIAGLFFTG